MAAALWTAGQPEAGEALGSAGALGGIPEQNRLDEYGEARMPSGYAGFCLRQPALCAPVKGSAAPIALTPARRMLIAMVNRAVNRAVTSATDEELYGKVEYWTLPDAAGDCEDYVLLKRETLARRGIPLASLLITVVRDENGEAHAVLSIPTTTGDLVLDNRRDEVLHWRDTGYAFLKRQSAADPARWVALSGGDLQATSVASGPGMPAR
jgi:predicted transglutaminase-like cysteine proteinase